MHSKTKLEKWIPAGTELRTNVIQIFISARHFTEILCLGPRTRETLCMHMCSLVSKRASMRVCVRESKRTQSAESLRESVGRYCGVSSSECGIPSVYSTASCPSKEAWNALWLPWQETRARSALWLTSWPSAKPSSHDAFRSAQGGTLNTNVQANRVFLCFSQWAESFYRGHLTITHSMWGKFSCRKEHVTLIWRDVSDWNEARCN